MLFSRFTDRAEATFCVKLKGIFFSCDGYRGNGRPITLPRCATEEYSAAWSARHSGAREEERRNGIGMLLTASRSIRLRNEHRSMSVLLGIYDTLLGIGDGIERIRSFRSQTDRPADAAMERDGRDSAR